MVFSYLGKRGVDLTGIIFRGDDNATRGFILNMMPEQRKKMGINKPMLWYIQKNLRECMKFKLYDKARAKMA